MAFATSQQRTQRYRLNEAGEVMNKAAIRPGMRDSEVTALAQYEGELLGSFIPLKRFAIHQHVIATKVTKGLHRPLIMIGTHRDRGS